MRKWTLNIISHLPQMRALVTKEKVTSRERFVHRETSLIETLFWYKLLLICFYVFVVLVTGFFRSQVWKPTIVFIVTNVS